MKKQYKHLFGSFPAREEEIIVQGYVTKKDTELLGQILEKLNYLEPGIKKFPVQPIDTMLKVFFLFKPSP